MSDAVQSRSTGSRGVRRHDLKTWPEFFADLLADNKPFELRKNDRDFQVGDELRLHEYDPATKAYSGRSVVRVVTYMLGHRPDAGCAATFGLQPGHVIMGISDAAQAGRVPDREAFWLVERMGTGLYVKTGPGDLTDNVWHAHRFANEREAFDYARLSPASWAKDLRATEHMFVNKTDAPQPRDPAYAPIVITDEMVESGLAAWMVCEKGPTRRIVRTILEGALSSVSSTHQSSPTATIGDIPSEPRPPASAAMGLSAGDDARARFIADREDTERKTLSNPSSQVPSTPRATGEG